MAVSLFLEDNFYLCLVHVQLIVQKNVGLIIQYVKFKV